MSNRTSGLKHPTTDVKVPVAWSLGHGYQAMEMSDRTSGLKHPTTGIT
ncbi:hypothetical protein [Aliiglaciecola aliphaticivorans]